MPENVFARAWRLFCANPVLLVPSLAVGIATAAIAYVLAASRLTGFGFFGDLNAQGPGAFGLFFATVVAFLLRMGGLLVTIAFTTGMAAAAWRGGHAVIADGASALRAAWLRTFGALVELFLLGFVAAFLALPTFGFSVLLYLIFFIYTVPATVVGGLGMTEAALDSLQTAGRNFRTTLLVVVMLVAIAVVAGVVQALLGDVPFLGTVVSWLLMAAVFAYASLVIVGEYLTLHGTVVPEGG